MPRTPILIIDDEASVLEGLTEFLEDEGYEVHQALEAGSALNVFRSVSPDVVLTDLKMPGISGIQLIREIRRLSKNVPIIVISGYGTFETAVDAIRLDVFDFITKPIDLDHLKSTLDQAHASTRVSQEIQKGMTSLKEHVDLLHYEWKDQLAKLSEVEPLIQVGRLLAAIIHNLNNPLTYIMGQAEILQALHPEVQNLGVIKDQALRMSKIMATVSKRVRQSQSREYEWLQLNKILEEEVFFQESHPYFKMEIHKVWQLDKDLPLFKGIAADFNQIFGNILRNAAEAMKEQPIKRLTMKTWHDAHSIYASIEDNGPGVPDYLKERIFQPFFSTKTSETSGFGGLGMGIGLYHCKEVVKQYCGQIEISGKQGAGAAFIVRLPRKDLRKDADAVELLN